MFVKDSATTIATPSHSDTQTSSLDTPPKQSIYWRTPVIMIGSLIIGILLAVGHHLYFNSLNGQPVPSQTQQAWNGRYGIALTFLIKTFLNVAISTACVQNIWWLLRSRTTKLETIDSVYGIMESALKLLNFRVWLHGPLVTLLAVGIWIILPLAAISPPTTLTVRGALTNSSVSMKIPNIEYANNNFALGGSSASGDYSGPAASVVRLVNAVSAQGSILNLTSAAPCLDCSYPLRFYGPIMTCNEVPNATHQLILDAIHNASNPSISEFSFFARPLYTAFVPQGSSTSSGGNITTAIVRALNSTFLKTFLSFDKASTDSAKTLLTYNATNSLQCNLYNASYEVNFEFVNGVQSIDVQKVTQLNGIGYQDDPPYFALNAYNLSATYSNASENALELGYTVKALQTLAYIAISQAINMMLVGIIYSEQSLGVVLDNTQIMSSSLSSTPELNYIVKAMSALSVDPRVPPVNDTNNTPLAQAIKDLSINVTLSLFSAPEFLQGGSSMTAFMAPAALTTPSNISVLTFTQQNVYVYSPRYLLLSWGIAIFYSLFAVLLGIFALAKNKLAYSNSFSTVLRTARHLHLDSVMLSAETTGADPLPKHLAKETFALKTNLGGNGNA